MSLAAKETSKLASGQFRKRSKGRNHERKHLAGETAAVDDESNQEGVPNQLHGCLDEQRLVNQLENEDTQSSVRMQDILGSFLATKLQVIESENQRIPKSVIRKKCQQDKSRRSSRKTSSKRSSACSDALANDEFNYDRNVSDCWSDSKSPNPLDFWNDSEHLSSRAMLDRTCVKFMHEDCRRSYQSRGDFLQKRDRKLSGQRVHCGFRSSTLTNYDGLERSYGNGAFPVSDIYLEHLPSSVNEEDGYRFRERDSCHAFPLEISQEYLSDFKEDDLAKSENHIHKSKRKHRFPKKSKEASESRHKKSKNTRTRKSSVEVSTFINPNSQTASKNAEDSLRCYQDSLYDDVNSASSENDDKEFGFGSERHSGSHQKSCDYTGTGLRKPDNQMVNSRKRNADVRLNDRDDLVAETWAERYNRAKGFKRHRSHSGSTPAEADADSLLLDKYSHLGTKDPIWGHSSERNRLVYEGELYTNCGDRADTLSHSRSNTHSRTKSPKTSLKKKSSRKVKHVNKHEKKSKHRNKSHDKSSHKHKSTKRKHRKNRNDDKVLDESNAKVEIAKSSVLPSDNDDDDNFRPMLIPVENNDDVTELWLGKRTTSKDEATEQCDRQQLDYNAVVACAEKISIPSRIVKTYKEGIAVSRLLRRVKDRMGPLRPIEISRLQATLPRHPVLTIDKCSQQKSTGNDLVQNSNVVQDVEDPGVQNQEQTHSCSILPIVSDVTTEHTSDDILQAPPSVLGEFAVVQVEPDDHLGLAADMSDPNHQDQLSDQTGAAQDTVLANLSHKEDVTVETSVDPLMTVETAAATEEPCLRLSSEGEVFDTDSVETTESGTNDPLQSLESGVTGNASFETIEPETYANDPSQEMPACEVAPEDVVSASVQNLSVESSDNIASQRVIQLVEDSCIQHSTEQDKRAEVEEVQDNLSSNCDNLPELACGSCVSYEGSQSVGNKVTAIVSSHEERPLEDITAVAIADHGTNSAEEISHLSDAYHQDGVSTNEHNQTQCFTLEASDIVGTGPDATGIEVNQIEVHEKEMTGKDLNENNASVNEVCEIEVIGKEVIGKEVTGEEVCENEATGNEVSDAEVECHSVENEMNPENEGVVNNAGNSEGIKSDVGYTSKTVFCKSQPLSAERGGAVQTLKAHSLIAFVREGCSDIPCDAEPVFESFKSPASKEDSKTGQKAPRKLARDMGIKISGWSAAFISSGTRYENDPKKRNREEGELTDSSATSSESEDFEPAPVERVLHLESSGSLSESVTGEIEEPVVKQKSKQRKKKHKRKHKKHKKHKRRHSIESSSDEEQSRSRSRSRSFSVARTFDEERGVWRNKKPKHIRKKVPAKTRPRLNIDKEKLREIAVKNSLHNQMSFKVPMSRLNESTGGTRPGGKTVVELTDFCKTISGKMDYSTSSSEDENSRGTRQRVMDSVEDESETFLTNFMKGRDKDARIVLNIRDSRQLPALSAQEMMAKKAVMRLMYPVSSGAEHRHKEEGWVPVTQSKPLPRSQIPSTDPPVPTFTIPAVPPTSAGAAAVELATARAPVIEHPLPLLPPNADVKVIITERLAAIRRLNADPTNEQAMEDVVRAQMQMQQWAEAKQIPGQFFSSVHQMGLMGNKLKRHDWLRRTKQNAEPGLVSPDDATTVLQSDPPGGSGATNSSSAVNPLATGPDGTYNIGKLMMLRMGWKECEGLGRQNLGRLTPLCLDMKKDRKGLQAPEERTRPMAQVLSVKGKHPVSALMETCVRCRIGQPEFVLAEETGPSHLKRFLYKVILNGVEYQPNIGSQNKKTARLQAAACCLDALGLSEQSK